MAARLDPKKILWLSAPETKAVMAALQVGNAGPPIARFVGGAVRDALLGRNVEDIDIACTLAPDEVMRRLTAAGIKAIPTGIDHGTITAVSDGHPFEITTLRRDVETFGRRARVQFTDDWAADASRRDFTMNAVYAEADGQVVDPLGGQDDIRAGRVRFIGDAQARITEDALRILRFFRFHAWYGQGNLDSVGLEACKANVPLLDILSIERVSKEILKLLGAPAPAATLHVMAESGVLQHVLPEAVHIDHMKRLQEIDVALGRVDALRRLAVLLQPTALQTGERLRLSRHQQARLLKMIRPLAAVTPDLVGHDLTAALYANGREEMVDHALLNWAASSARVDDGAWQALLDRLIEAELPLFPLAGADIVARGVLPGPEVGRILAEVERLWISAYFPKDQARIKGLLDHVLAGL